MKECNYVNNLCACARVCLLCAFFHIKNEITVNVKNVHGILALDSVPPHLSLPWLAWFLIILPLITFI